jgi:hypothetical protein
MSATMWNDTLLDRVTKVLNNYLPTIVYWWLNCGEKMIEIDGGCV